MFCVRVALGEGELVETKKEEGNVLQLDPLLQLEERARSRRKIRKERKLHLSPPPVNAHLHCHLLLTSNHPPHHQRNQLHLLLLVVSLCVCCCCYTWRVGGGL